METARRLHIEGVVIAWSEDVVRMLIEGTPGTFFQRAFVMLMCERTLTCGGFFRTSA